jgi:hypothetical protein
MGSRKSSVTMMGKIDSAAFGLPMTLVLTTGAFGKTRHEKALDWKQGILGSSLDFFF